MPRHDQNPPRPVENLGIDCIAWPIFKPRTLAKGMEVNVFAVQQRRFGFRISKALQPAAAFVEILRQIPKAMKDFLLNKAGYSGLHVHSWLPLPSRQRQRQAEGTDFL